MSTATPPTYEEMLTAAKPPGQRPVIDLELSERKHDWWFKATVQMPSYYVRIADTNAWSCGRSPDDAVDSLLRTHPELFGITREACNAMPTERYCENQLKWGFRVLYLGKQSR